MAFGKVTKSGFWQSGWQWFATNQEGKKIIIVIRWGSSHFKARGTIICSLQASTNVTLPWGNLQPLYFLPGMQYSPNRCHCIAAMRIWVRLGCLSHSHYGIAEPILWYKLDLLAFMKFFSVWLAFWTTFKKISVVVLLCSHKNGKVLLPNMKEIRKLVCVAFPLPILMSKWRRYPSWHVGARTMLNTQRTLLLRWRAPFIIRATNWNKII